MNRLKLSVLVLMTVAILLLPLKATGAPNQVYTYFWQPRSEDVGGKDDPHAMLLSAILALSQTSSYTLVQGDSLDFVIRKNFYVSGGQFPHAFQIYLQRILSLNTGLTAQTVLKVGGIITIPNGPQFSATSLTDNAGTPLVSDALFRNFQALAFSARISTEDHLAPLAVRSLRAFVAATPKVASQQSSLKKLYAQIKEAKIVPAIDLSVHPNVELAQGQPVDLTLTDESRASLDVIRDVDGEHLYRGLIPMAAAVPDQCAGVCKACMQIVGVPSNFDFSKARVLVEDGGIDPTAFTDPTLQKMIIPQPANPQYPVPSSEDVTSDHHGRFVYSQLVMPSNPADGVRKGMLPARNVYVTRVARTVDQGGTQYYSMSDILNGWKVFEAKLLDPKDPANANLAQTWIVNMSLFGEASDSADSTPAPPRSDHLLFIVAAGNNQSNTAASLYAFARFAGPGNAVLSVGAVGVDDLRASYSNYHPANVSLVARGDCVCGSPGQINGTSQATPVVTTAAAALTAQYPDLLPVEVMWRLISTADRQAPVDTKDSLGGKLNLANALTKNIIVTENLSGTTTSHRITSLTLPGSVFQESGGQELLRISRQAQQPQCFTIMRKLAPTDTLCPNSNDKSVVSILEGGTQKDIPLGNVIDIILPIGRWRDTSVSFPTVLVAP